MFLGPVLLHKKQEQESFGIFAGEMVNLRPELGNVQCIGTDREKAIFKGYARHMPAAKLVLYTKHMKDNIVSYLSIGEEEHNLMFQHCHRGTGDDFTVRC